jgi:hypothetical protein
MHIRYAYRTTYTSISSDQRLAFGSRLRTTPISNTLFILDLPISMPAVSLSL